MDAANMRSTLQLIDDLERDGLEDRTALIAALYEVLDRLEIHREHDTLTLHYSTSIRALLGALGIQEPL